MKQIFFLCAIILLIGIQGYAQNGVAINTTGADADNSAILDVSSTEKGFLPPRMTDAQRDAIGTPVPGLVLWCSNCGTSGELQVYNGTIWVNLAGAATSGSPGCVSPLVDSRDGKSYSTVLIGTQCWMAENLNVGAKIDSAASQTNNSVTEKYCIGNKESNCTTYGGLYAWGETVQYLNGAGNTTTWNPEPSGSVQGICPAGWHLPSNTEWATLITSLGGASVAGGEMKETGTTHWASPNTDATNGSGFTALPGGIRIASGSFIFLTNAADWWSSTQSDASNADYTFINSTSASATSAATDSKALGYSVRCIKDN